MSKDDPLGMASLIDPQDKDDQVEHVDSDNVQHELHVSNIEEVDSDQLRRGQRARTLTEKGLSYQLDILSKKCKKSLNQVQAKSEHIRSQFIEDVSKHERELLYSHWLTLYEHFLDAYDDVVVLLSDQDKQTYLENFYVPNQTSLEAFKISCQQWVSHTKVEHTKLQREQILSETKYISRINDDTKSNKSTSSHATSIGSALSMAKLKEEQIKAELLVKATALKKKKLIEQAKLRLQLEEDEFEIENAMAMSDPRQDVVDKL
jgi:hypothetical protein